MKTLSGYILFKILGWKVNGEFPNVKKSIIIFLPQIRYCDVIYSKLFFLGIGIKYIFLLKKELFIFPLKYLLKLFNSIPTQDYSNIILQVIEMFHTSDELHVAILPEGFRLKNARWNEDIYYMARLAKVPIVITNINPKKKEIGMKFIPPENIEMIISKN